MESKFVVDHITLVENTLRIKGWYTDEREITSVILEHADGRRGHVGPVQYGLASPDVASIYGAGAINSRYDVKVDLPNPLTLEVLQRTMLEFHTGDEVAFRAPIYTGHKTPSNSIETPLSRVSLGIGVTTYNRSSILMETLQAIQELTQTAFHLAVCDDGSTDDTIERCNMVPGLSLICGSNRGVAWNKNRALFYLHQIKKCNVIILLEDDTRPVRHGWEIEWILATLIHGHINYGPHWFPNLSGGNGSWHLPYQGDILSGQCSGFSDEALNFVGYLDTRFGRYGHEHVEHTLRMIRAGYGGIDRGGSLAKFFLLDGNLEVANSKSSHTPTSVAENGEVFKSIWNESIHRWAWRSDDEMETLRNEMDAARQF